MKHIYIKPCMRAIEINSSQILQSSRIIEEGNVLNEGRFILNDDDNKLINNGRVDPDVRDPFEL